ncbi:hypothetical protein CHR29_16625 [Pseudomonas monteilii]|uniref:Uncharacterized protein n=2 Tax=Pseudomonas TaxID=286 RepID=A0AAP7FIG1_9PSED|nr:MULTISPECIES: hypothetical protein [Pseudomonas]AYN16683.1 hypothetical protein CHR29_16625 [Pseudomonas monteilii]MCT8192018.1 hypothetical protein [Pseudomonas monteilii]MDD2108896.1 hypothetical protein [Pseudomonas asiatica]MDH0025478.1 hypothetical protein [Pseudomonas monteilii]OAH45504.1 hypothetical protein AYJ70_20985 [Pseudomonas monteilii]
MKITDLDLKEMIGEISGTVSSFVFKDIEPGASAKTYIDRAALQGEVMGRIMAVLINEEICPESIAQDVERCVGYMQDQIIKEVRAGVGPGGAISASMVADELARRRAKNNAL